MQKKCFLHIICNSCKNSSTLKEFQSGNIQPFKHNREQRTELKVSQNVCLCCLRGEKDVKPQKEVARNLIFG